MKTELHRSAYDIAEGMEKLIDIIQCLSWEKILAYPHPKVLIIAPPPLIGERKMSLSRTRYEEAPQKSRMLAPLYRELALQKNTAFLDAATILSCLPPGEAQGIDGMHLNEADHAMLAQAVYEKLLILFSDGPAQAQQPGLAPRLPSV